MLPCREEIAYSTPYSDQRLFKTYMPPSVAVFSNGAPWQHPQPPHTNDTELHTEKPALSTALIHLQTQPFSPAGRYRGLRRAVCLLPRHPLTHPWPPDHRKVGETETKGGGAQEGEARQRVVAWQQISGGGLGPPGTPPHQSSHPQEWGS